MLRNHPEAASDRARFHRALGNRVPSRLVGTSPITSDSTVTHHDRGQTASGDGRQFTESRARALGDDRRGARPCPDHPS